MSDKKNSKTFWVPQKSGPVTRWPLVVHRRLTQIAQSFPYRRILPSPAGFDINTRLWLTEAPALGWAPGGLHSTFNSPFSLLIYCPRWPLVDPFPLSVCSQGTPKTVPQQYICFMISWGADGGKTSPHSPHLFQLMCSGPVGLLWSCRQGKRACGVTSSMWIFHFPSMGTRRRREE